ncbi:hypothetical protein EST38_g14306 [Candolleomyces aberdarensis]|uniref:Peptidase M43 pregnancy-associated plasma-A domain-containing protein n=1 Tax=Candolleomyces aberdarensis TaxID=2316362 RepID=A0A4Q2CYM1_9AGAR|nr:hypothetical protein EST38_g14306 [Candolleomyces aberdarensis]
MKYLLYLCCLIHLPLPILAIHKQADPLVGALGPRAAAARSARCTDLDPSVVQSFERQFAADKQAHATSVRRAVDTNISQPLGTVKKRQTLQAPITVHFHVISGDQSPENGNVPDEQIQSQIREINSAFAQTGLTFVLGGIDRTVNNDWFSNGGPDTYQQTAMKAALRNGGPADLNLYTVNFTGAWAGLLGYSTFPQQYKSNPSDDGVVVLYSSLPGGSMADYDQGKTAVHEIGHWVGLYHTFQGGCFGPGDYVSDTPPEEIPSEGCIEGRKTCLIPDLLQGVSDPIHNYMDYSPDSCMTEFTPGQADRARSQLKLYRGEGFN